MSFEQETNCEDFARRFDGFLDGEMDSHAMRAMALHASRCPTCGGDVERAEALQGALVRSVESELDRLDTSGLWSAIEARLEPPRGALRERLREYLAERRWFAPLPEYAAKLAEARQTHHLPEHDPVLFLEVRPGDTSNFSELLKIEGKRIGPHQVTENTLWLSKDHRAHLPSGC